jgi:hypothetical protein
VLCPFGYIAVGALGGFRPVFALITLPPLLAATACLLVRFLSKPSEAPTVRRWLLVAEIASWLVILWFLTVISRFTLLTPFERIGVSSMFFLVATVLCLPVVLLRRTALQQRLAWLPSGAATFALFAILLGAAALAIVYLVREPSFM